MPKISNRLASDVLTQFSVDEYREILKRMSKYEDFLDWDAKTVKKKRRILR